LQASRTAPELALAIRAILSLWFLFAFSVVFANIVFDVLLRLDDFGRLALSEERLLAANWVSACLLAGLVALGAWVVRGGLPVLMLAAWYGLTVLPMAKVIINRNVRRPSFFMAFYNLTVVGGGALALGHSLAEEEDWAFTFGLPFFVMAFMVAMVLADLHDHLKTMFAKN
jgi:hypothetical protein